MLYQLAGLLLRSWNWPRPSADSAARDANQHFLSAAKRDLLVSMKCSRSKTGNAPDDRPNPSSLAPAEDSAQQSTSTGSNRRMRDAFAPSTTGFDRTFHIDFLARGCVVELNNFGVNRSATAI